MSTENSEGNSSDIVIAKPFTRLGAVMLDFLICCLPFILLFGFLVFFGVGGSRFSPEAFKRGHYENMGGVLLVAGLSLLWVLALSIYQIYKISTTGQSIGKRILGLKIIKQDGDDAGFLHGVFLRSWVFGLLFSIPFLGPLLQFTDCCFVFSEDCRTLHDRLAGTIVVTKK